MMQMIIDRIEGDKLIAELEDGSMAAFPRAMLPEAAEGDVAVLTVDAEKTQERREKIRGLRRRLSDDRI